MQKRILILGGGTSHVPIIKIANEIGLYTIAMDKNPVAEGLKIARKGLNLDGGNRDEVLKVAQNEKVHGILATGDYSVIPAAYASEKSGLISLGIKTANLVTNKGKLFSRFAKYKVPIPPRVVVTNFKDAIKAVKKIGLPVILKPEYSYGASRGVVRVNDISELEEKFRFTEGFCLKSGIIVEKFVDGLEHTIESITVNGKTTVLAISDKIRTKNPYCVATSLDYPSKQGKEILKKLKSAARKAIKVSGIKNGASHIEAISFNNQVYVIDFGGRGGAGGFIPSVVVPEINGVNMMEKMIKISLGEKVGSLKPRFSHGVVYRFFTAKPGIIQNIKGVKKVKRFPWLIDLKFHVKKGDRVEVLSNQLLRPGYFVVIGKSMQEAEKRAKLIQKLVKIETR